ncbi:MAG: glycosyl hydrolase family 25 [Patescibacteria group bacterium]|nr:glycosyl hydrolase family 25 [Patescibacteria group bacterium]
MPIRGADISSYQGQVDFAAVKASGQIDFIFAKATEGISEVDPQFARNKVVCAERGIPFGAYHFFHPSEDPKAQALHFLRSLQSRVAGVQPPELRPMVDVEIDEGCSAAQIVSALKAFLATLGALGRSVLIYTDYGFWNDNVGGSSAFPDHLLWLAEYNNDAEPTLPGGWTDWVLWQHTASGHVDGISGDVDLDLLNPRVAFKALQV